MSTPNKQTSANTPKPNGIFNCGINAAGTAEPGPTGSGPWCGYSLGYFGASAFGVDTLSGTRQDVTISDGSYISGGGVLFVTATVTSG